LIIGRIYALADPRDIAKLPDGFHEKALIHLENGELDAPHMDQWFKSISYIGKTTNSIHKRLRKHIRESRDKRRVSHKNNWIIKLVKDGVEPISLLILETETSNKELNKIEIEAIRFFREHGSARTNTTHGGDGFSLQKISPEQRREHIKKVNENLGPEGRRARALKNNATLGAEGRSAKMKKVAQTLGAEGLSKRSKKAMQTMGKEGIAARNRKGIETMGPEARSARTKKMNDNLGVDGRRAAALKRVATLGPAGIAKKQAKSWRTRSLNNPRPYPLGISYAKSTKFFTVVTSISEFGYCKYIGCANTLEKAIEKLNAYRLANPSIKNGYNN